MRHNGLRSILSIFLSIWAVFAIGGGNAFADEVNGNAFASSLGVAGMLGVHASEIAKAVEEGAGRNQKPEVNRVNLPQKLEESRFLLRANVFDNLDTEVDLAAKPTKGAYWPAVKSRKQREDEVKKAQQQAIEQLRFRKTVEDAMSKILSFQPNHSRFDELNGGDDRIPKQVEANVDEPKPVKGCETGNVLSARDRLLSTVCRGSGQVRRDRQPAVDEGQSVSLESFGHNDRFSYTRSDMRRGDQMVRHDYTDSSVKGSSSGRAGRDGLSGSSGSRMKGQMQRHEYRDSAIKLNYDN